MKALSITTALLATVFLASLAITFAEAGQGNGPGDGTCPNFVDEDGDGVNDNCTGDGTRPQDGTGNKNGAEKGRRNGDGVNDNCPNGGNQPQDGTGVKKRSKRGTRSGVGRRGRR
jgi:hypothetical protein